MRFIVVLQNFRSPDQFYAGEVRYVSDELANTAIKAGWAGEPGKDAPPAPPPVRVTLEVQNGKHASGTKVGG